MGLLKALVLVWASDTDTDLCLLLLLLHLCSTGHNDTLTILAPAAQTLLLVPELKIVIIAVEGKMADILVKINQP
jgi:hypothetical protein